MFTCVIRYHVDLEQLSAFRDYAQAWIGLIRKYGGTHHGYFMPGTSGDVLPAAAFSFPDVAAYERYRLAVADDEACKAATARFNETPCFSGYERSFLVPIFD